ncbi:hypothetical protein HF259_06215 [Rhizobium leguminosarum]|uniref:hypothetical protein n=1 Tax=Rhizobium leguminosarum TaxID=384 RepID=UPI001C928661|nr:hypothetical protein [Rhizobium leguminosarum]MBY2921033.1 hypothetical protein [Rhizobium leguminosarum]
MPDIEGAITPSQFVERFAKAGIHISERTLRERARQIGAYRQMGKTMFFMTEDIDTLIEASKPKPRRPQEATGSLKLDRRRHRCPY